MPEPLLIKNIKLFDSGSNASTEEILIENGIIRYAGEQRIPALNHEVMDGRGFTALPGLIDMHIHGSGGADSLDGTPDAMETISRSLASSGTTSFLSTMVSRPGTDHKHIRMAAECFKSGLSGAELLGIYIEGPFINPVRKGGITSASISPGSAGVLESILAGAGNALKVMCVAPEIEGAERIIRILQEAGVLVAFGHSDADYDMTMKGFDMGISHVTHLYNAMRPLHHRDPGPVAAIFDREDVTVELIGDSHHVHPSMLRMARRFKGADGVACITDGISAMGLPEGTYTYNDRKYISKEGLARYPDGTFIGSTMSLNQVMKNYMNLTDCDLAEAVKTVTLNPARILGIENRKGSIEPGKDADIVLVDDSMDVRYTIVGGKIVWSGL